MLSSSSESIRRVRGKKSSMSKSKVSRYWYWPYWDGQVGFASASTKKSATARLDKVMDIDEDPKPVEISKSTYQRASMMVGRGGTSTSGAFVLSTEDEKYESGKDKKVLDSLESLIKKETAKK